MNEDRPVTCIVSKGIVVHWKYFSDVDYADIAGRSYVGTDLVSFVLYTNAVARLPVR